MIFCSTHEITNNENNKTNIDGIKNFIEALYENIDEISPYIVSKEREKEKIINEFEKDKSNIKSNLTDLKNELSDMKDKIQKEKIFNDVLKQIYETAKTLKVNGQLDVESKLRLDTMVNNLIHSKDDLAKLTKIQSKIKKLLN